MNPTIMVVGGGGTDPTGCMHGKQEMKTNTGSGNGPGKRKWSLLVYLFRHFQSLASYAILVPPLRKGESKFRQQSCLIGFGEDTLLVYVYVSLCTVQTQLHKSY